LADLDGLMDDEPSYTDSWSVLPSCVSVSTHSTDHSFNNILLCL